ncbi:uncharacterized protein LOC133824237 [Humulus lupulus]|uniref:uncharacterized protein LOC133824237 n=1 Tax=Humulus lupulus TaxID=3486 RepID=UPI002B404AB2|nr:uncharacterized protein LOC133824237 [Humulus lupulus]
MVRTRGAHSKKTPSNLSNPLSKTPVSTAVPSSSALPKSVSTPSSSAGTKPKMKPRKQTTPVLTVTPLVFPDVDAAVPVLSPPPKGVVTEKESVIPSSQSALIKKTRASEKGSVEPSPPKKSSLPPKTNAKGFLKRKTPSDSTVSPLSSVKKRLKDNPPSPSTSEADEEEETVAEESTEDIPEKVASDKELSQEPEESATDSEPREEEDVASSDPDVDTVSSPVAAVPSSVVTKPSSKGKGKKPISRSGSPLTKSVVKFQPHSYSFCYNDNERDMILYAHRKFLPERNFVLSDHRSFGVLILLQTREWVGSLVKLSGYVERVVKEFYANLTNDVLDPKSPHFEKVYVRGQWYSFAPKDIAIALQIPIATVEDQAAETLDRDEVLSELVGQRMQWSPNTVLLVTNLTNMYAVLHKFATSNWKPTSHTNTISFDLAAFLYKVGTGIEVDLAKHIFDQIVGFRRGNRKSLNLPFPHLIYKILSMQNNVIKLETEDLVLATTAVSFRSGGPLNETGEAPSAKKVKPQSLNFVSEDLPPDSVPSVSPAVATELAFLRSGMADLHTKFAIIQQSIQDLLMLATRASNS